MISDYTTAAFNRGGGYLLLQTTHVEPKMGKVTAEEMATKVMGVPMTLVRVNLIQINERAGAVRNYVLQETEKYEAELERRKARKDAKAS